MMRAEQRNQSANVHSPSLRVVVVDKDQATIESEIERHVKVIRSLIQKLRPTDRQKYFDGLLSHIIDEPAKVSKGWNQSTRWQRSDYSNLTVRELSLLEELSEKMEHMYRMMEHE
jgi:hypothetical protein